MKKTITKIIMLALIGLSNVTNGQAPNWDWAKSAASTGDDYVQSITTDAFGNVYVTGGYNSATITFGADTLTSAGGGDMFLIKYDASGNVLWAKGAGGTGNEGGGSTTTDAFGNVYVTGSYTSTAIIFGADTLTNAGSYDIFIAKYDANGNVLWAKKQTAGGTGDDIATSVAADANGNVFVTGFFYSSTITFGTDTLTTAGGSDIFVAKYDTNGNVLWARKQTAGGTGSDYANSVAADDSGNVIITGDFYEGSNYLGVIIFGTDTFYNYSNFAGCIFTVKYDGNGNVLWARDAWGNSFGNSMSADASGNVYVTGGFITPSIVFGSYLLSNANWPSADIFIVKYAANGNVLWARKDGSTGEDYGQSITTDAIGNVYLTGKYASPTITIGLTTLTNAGAAYTFDIFIAKYNASGSVLWAKSAGGTGAENGCLTTDVFNNVYVAGSYNSPSITFGADTLTNAGSSDMFIAKLDAITGIEENDFDNDVSIYPNPTTGIINIAGISNETIIVYNSLGAKVKELKNENKIDVSSCSAGLYLVQILNSGGKIIAESKVLRQ